MLIPVNHKLKLWSQEGFFFQRFVRLHQKNLSLFYAASRLHTLPKKASMCELEKARYYWFFHFCSTFHLISVMYRRLVRLPMFITYPVRLYHSYHWLLLYTIYWGCFLYKIYKYFDICVYSDKFIDKKNATPNTFSQ